MIQVFEFLQLTNVSNEVKFHLEYRIKEPRKKCLKNFLARLFTLSHCKVTGFHLNP